MVRLVKGGVAAVLVGMLAVPACAAGGHPGAGASPSPTALSDARLQVLVNDLVRCIREHGAPGMPDVRVRNGHIVDPDENSVDTTTKANFETAREACKTFENRIPPGVLDGGGGDSRQQGDPTAADVPKLRQFAKCLRENGLPDWPDPRADGSFPATAAVTGEGKSPRFMAAVQACRKYWDGGFRVSP
jgi:hypothetical protein